jgi:hypothetical protein
MEHAKRRLRVARYAIGATAVGAFGAFAIAARASHPGTHHASTSSSTATASSDDSATSDDFFGAGGSPSFDNSGSTPQVQSGGS